MSDMQGIIKDTFDNTRVFVSSGERPSADLVSADLDREKVLESVYKLSKKSKNVLGTIEGVYFVPDGYSRNKRFYPKELWQSVLERVVPTLNSRAMLGTLEHPETDGDAHPRHASHVVKRLWIGEDGKGYGKSYILNTPIGSLVYVLGSSLDEEGNPLVPLYMSSRGLGKVSGYTNNGYEIVDPRTYILETFDVVIDPGFVEAKPALSGLVESVVPEVIEMEGLQDKESFYFLLESIVSNRIEEPGEDGGYTGRPEGFIKDDALVPINESPGGLGMEEGIVNENTVPDWEVLDEGPHRAEPSEWSPRWGLHRGLR